MPKLLNEVQFRAASGGTGEFIPDTAIQGWYLPQDVIDPAIEDGERYYLRAESDDMTQYELTECSYSASPPSFQRLRVIQSSNADALVNFTLPPKVRVVAIAQSFSELGVRALSSAPTLSDLPHPDTYGVFNTGGSSGSPADLGAVIAANIGDQIVYLTKDIVQQSRAYFVSTTGDNDNDGKSSGTAWRDIQHAIDFISRNLYILAGRTVTINIADGTYNEELILGVWQGPGNVSIVGNAASPSSVLIRPLVNTQSFGALNIYDCIGTVRVTGVKLDATGFGGWDCLGVENCRGVFVQDCVFEQLTDDGWTCARLINSTVSFGAANTFIMPGSQQGLILAQVYSLAIFTGTITITGTPAFAIGGFYCDAYSRINVSGPTFVGTATGVRARIDNMSKVICSSDDPAYLPGTTSPDVQFGSRFITPNSQADGLVELTSPPTIATRLPAQSTYAPILYSDDASPSDSYVGLFANIRDTLVPITLTKLLNDITLTVDGATGNDTTGTGAAEAPFRTIMAAVRMARTFNLNGWTLTIKVLAGTYAEETVVLPPIVGAGVPGDCRLQGDDNVPANVFIDRSHVSGSRCIQVLGGKWSISGFKLRQGANGRTIEILRASQVDIGNSFAGKMHYVAPPSGAGRILQIGQASVVAHLPDVCIIEGAWQMGASVGNQSFLDWEINSYELLSTPSFSTAFLHGFDGATIYHARYVGTTGSATGARVSLTTAIYLSTFSDFTDIPGNSTGSWDHTSTVNSAFGLLEVASPLSDASIALEKSGFLTYYREDASPSESWIGFTANILGKLVPLPRIKLLSDLTLAVDAATGNDATGTGAADAPYASINKAASFLADHVDLNGFTATIQVADGTYVGRVNLRPLVGAVDETSCVLRGNPTNPSAVFIDNSSLSFQTCIVVAIGARWTVYGFKLKPSDSSNAISVSGASTVNVGGSGTGGMHFVGPSNGLGSMFSCFNIATLTVSLPTLTVEGNWGRFLFAGGDCVVAFNITNLIYSGAVAFGTAGFSLNDGAVVSWSYTNVSGSATGTQFTAVRGSHIVTGAGDAIPGSTTGTLDATSSLNGDVGLVTTSAFPTTTDLPQASTQQVITYDSGGSPTEPALGLFANLNGEIIQVAQVSLDGERTFQEVRQDRSRTPAVGDAAGFRAKVETAAGTVLDFGNIHWVATDVTASNEKSDAVITTRRNGQIEEGIRALSDGTVNFRGIKHTPSDAGLTVLYGWHEPSNTYKSLLLGDYSVEASPAAGDFLTVMRAEGDVVLVNWSSLPGGGGTAASQAEQEAGTSTTVFTSPGRQHFHPSAAKFWVYWTANSTTILRSYNIDSIADTAVGDADGTITTDFSDANWAGFVSTNDTTTAWDAANTQGSGFNARAAGTFGVLCSTITDGGTAVASLTDPDQWQVVGFGDI